MSALEPPDATVPAPAEDEPPAPSRRPRDDPPTPADAPGPSTTECGRARRRALAQYPPVVAVVVTRNPGPWLEDTLVAAWPSRTTTTSPSSSSTAAPTTTRPRGSPRCSRARSSAASTTAPGFPGAANEALHTVEGATFLLLCHDDVVLDPTALRAAGGGGVPVQRRHPRSQARERRQPRDPARGRPRHRPLRRARTPGSNPASSTRSSTTACATSSTSPPPSCSCAPTSSRSSTASIPATFPGAEDLDLCWRARLAGARVLVAPDARVAHREAADRSLRRRPARRVRARPVARARALHVVLVPPAALAGARSASSWGSSRRSVTCSPGGPAAPGPRSGAGSRTWCTSAGCVRRGGARRRCARSTTPSCASCRSRPPRGSAPSSTHHLHTDTRLRTLGDASRSAVDSDVRRCPHARPRSRSSASSCSS